VIALIEEYLGKKAVVRREPFQKTDMAATLADIGKAKRLLDWVPQIPLAQGLKATVDWYVGNKEWAGNIVIDMTK
jgi:UDP-glucuronate 4-epimerase